MGKTSFKLGIWIAKADKYGRPIRDFLRMGVLLAPASKKTTFLKEKILRGGTIAMAGILLLAVFCAGCFFSNEKTQYIVLKDGKNLQPYAKVVYRISAEKQEVVYWIETPRKERSKVYHLKKCVVTDADNWQGEADYILLWKIRVAMVDGKIGPPGEGLANAGWFTWHLRTNPSPGPFSTLLRYTLLLFLLLAMIGAIWVVLRIVKRRERAAARRIRAA
jgi:hypothetical protein